MREIALTSMDHEIGDPINSPKTGKDLHNWRKALGLRQSELAQILGLNHHTISRAERATAARLKGQLLIAVQLLQHRLVHGEIDLSPIFKKRPPIGRPRKKE
jgi:transcriptional regulator with XRE-family HTH domain